MTNTITTKPACIAQDHIPELGIYVTTFDCDPCPSGHQHGAWIDLEDAIVADDIQAGIDWILATSSKPDDKEWSVEDDIGLPSYLSNTERPDLSELMSWVNGLSAYENEYQREAYLLLCENRGQTIDDDEFQDTYYGHYSSEEDYAKEWAEELLINGYRWLWPLTCMNWEEAWHELTSNNSYWSEPSSSWGVHIFKNN